MKKLALFGLLMIVAANVCAMDVAQWLSDENRANKTATRIEEDARALVAEGKMTEVELEQVLAAIKN